MMKTITEAQLTTLFEAITNAQMHLEEYGHRGNASLAGELREARWIIEDLEGPDDD